MLPVRNAAHHSLDPGTASVVARGCTLKRREHLLNVETADLLTWWEFLEGGQEITDVLLRGHEEESSVYPPFGIADPNLVRFFEWIGAQIKYLREAQRHERLLPDIEAFRALLGEDDLPLVVTQRHQRAISLK